MSKQIKRVRESSCGWLVKVLGQRMDDVMRDELKKIGLNIRHFATLISLLEKDDLTQAELGRRVGQPEYATSRVIDALEELELVERQSHPESRRSHRIKLTAKGREYHSVLPAVVKRVNKLVLAHFDRPEHDELVRLLQKALKI